MGNSHYNDNIGVTAYIFTTIFKVSEFEKICPESDGLLVGAAVTLADLDKAMKQQIKVRPKTETQILASIVNILPNIASNQVRNVISVIGNLCVSDSIYDLHNIFLAACVKIWIIDSKGNKRKVTVNQEFFEGNVLTSDDIIVSYLFPWTKEEELFQIYKHSKRRTCSLAIVNSAFYVRINDSNVVQVSYIT